jgi:hypothetical protein
MAASIKGTAVFWSTGAITFTAGIVSSSNASMVQSATIERTSDVARIKSTDGTVRTVVFSGLTRNLRITVVPCGATPPTTSTIADAKTSAEAYIPKAGTLITVADDAGSVIDGNYNCISATQNRTVDGVVTVDLVLEGSDESTDITTLVS